jgi:hypothetical protein
MIELWAETMKFGVFGSTEPDQHATFHINRAAPNTASEALNVTYSIPLDIVCIMFNLHFHVSLSIGYNPLLRTIGKR